MSPTRSPSWAVNALRSETTTTRPQNRGGPGGAPRASTTSRIEGPIRRKPRKLMVKAVDVPGGDAPALAAEVKANSADLAYAIENTEAERLPALRRICDLQAHELRHPTAPAHA